MDFIDKGKTIIDLYVKASTLDKRSIDANPVDQQYFMAFQLLDRADRLILHEVVTISSESPPKDYVALNVGSSLPVVHILQGPRAGDILSHCDDIDRFIDSFALPEMRACKTTADQAEAEKFLSLKTKLNIFLSDTHDDSSALVKVLRQFDAFLADQACTYALSDTMGFVDCLLLPRLHHVRVAGKAFKDFEIPADLIHVWRYLSAGYSSDIFTRSCPADEDVLAHYAQKSSRKIKMNPKFTNTRTFSFNISPVSLVN